MRTRKSLIFLFIFALLTSFSAFSSSKDYNIFVQMENDMTDFVQQISDHLFDYNSSLNTFYRQEMPLHVTLYLASFPEGNLPMLKEEVEEIAKTTSSFKTNPTKVERTIGNWLFVVVENKKDLQDLSDRAVGNLFVYRDTSAEVPGWAKGDPNKVKKFKEYGSPNVHDEFLPHFTLLANANENLLKSWLDNYTETLAGKLEWGPRKIVSIGIGEADANGQITKILASYPLK